jgi:hypothetical protein
MRAAGHHLYSPSFSLYVVHVRLIRGVLMCSICILQLASLHAIELSTPAAPLDITSGAIQSIRVTSVYASALAYLPSFALDALFAGSSVPGQTLRIGFGPVFEAPGFQDHLPAAQVSQDVLLRVCESEMWSVFAALLARAPTLCPLPLQLPSACGMVDQRWQRCIS